MGKETPWIKHYTASKRRCHGGLYEKLGVLFNLTIEDVKFLWFRDSAMNMDRPSIDRINTLGGYVLENCRFIELSENRKRPRRKSQTSNNPYKGVYWQRSHKRWRVCITKDGRLRHIGYFANPEEAAIVYDKMIKTLFPNERFDLNNISITKTSALCAGV